MTSSPVSSCLQWVVIPGPTEVKQAKHQAWRTRSLQTCQRLPDTVNVPLLLVQSHRPLVFSSAENDSLCFQVHSTRCPGVSDNLVDTGEPESSVPVRSCVLMMTCDDPSNHTGSYRLSSEFDMYMVSCYGTAYIMGDVMSVDIRSCMTW